MRRRTPPRRIVRTPAEAEPMTPEETAGRRRFGSIQDFAALAAVLTALAGGGTAIWRTVSGGDDERDAAPAVHKATSAAGKEPAAPSHPADAVARAAATAFSLGDWGKHYDLLHPHDQALVSRADYIRCMRAEIRPADLVTATYVGVFGTTSRPDVPGSIDLKYRMTFITPKGRETDPIAMPVAKTGDRYGTLLTPEEKRVVTKGRCSGTASGDQLLP